MSGGKGVGERAFTTGLGGGREGSSWGLCSLMMSGPLLSIWGELVRDGDGTPVEQWPCIVTTGSNMGGVCHASYASCDALFACDEMKTLKGRDII